MTSRPKSKATAPAAAPMFTDKTDESGAALAAPAMPTAEDAVAHPLQAALQHAAALRAARPAEEAPTPKRPRAPGAKYEALFEAASRGELPPAPDFGAPTHAPYRKKLAQCVALVEAGDIDGLKAVPINPISTSPKAIERYRNLAVVALAARARKAAT